MLSLYLRNLFFTLLQPGLVAGLFPYWILGKPKFQQELTQPFRFHHFAGIAVFVIGLVILLDCIIRFPREGKGTISPADPTKKLVTKGLYKYSRNPMYIGVMLVLMGEAIFFQSGSLWAYLMFVFIFFNLFILAHEEPRLRRVFGEEYEQYCKSVRRWL